MPDLAAVPPHVPDPAHTQQCGRCRAVFDMAPDAEPGTIAEMWLCANCRVALLGRPRAAAKPPV